MIFLLQIYSKQKTNDVLFGERQDQLRIAIFAFGTFFDLFGMTFWIIIFPCLNMMNDTEYIRDTEPW
jgi:hypothetical protein